MSRLFRQFSPLLVSLVFGIVFSIVIAIAAVNVTWTNAESASSGIDHAGEASVDAPMLFRDRQPGVPEPGAVRWVDGPLFHAALVMRVDAPEGADPREASGPSTITDAYIKAGFPWPWLERHDESIARTLFAAENPWLKAELAPEYMGFDDRFNPGLEIDLRALLADVLFFTALLLFGLALLSMFRGDGGFCGLPAWLAASMSLGVALPVLMAWTSGLMLVGPSTLQESLTTAGVMDLESAEVAGDPGILQDEVVVPGGRSIVTWANADVSDTLPLISSELRLGWPVTMARTTECTLPVIADSWEEVLLGLGDEGYLDLDHASLWKVIRAPVIWSGWFIDTLFWGLLAALILFPCIMMRRWIRHRAGRCVACRHRLAGATCCYECGRSVGTGRIRALLGSSRARGRPTTSS
jgi:hypothetical protein